MSGNYREDRRNELRGLDDGALRDRAISAVEVHYSERSPSSRFWTEDVWAVCLERDEHGSIYLAALDVVRRRRAELRRINEMRV